MTSDLDKIIIDRSAAQKAARVDKLRIELEGMGFSVIRTDRLLSLIKQERSVRREAYAN